MSAAASVALPEIGHVVGGKYVLERELGRGGMGAVFAARHVRMHHAVAIKVMLADPTNQEALTRFMNEARAAGNIQSEHVVRVSDVDEESGYAYMVLELLEGEDVARVLERERRLTPQVATGYAIQALNGVAQAHAQGIVHRDLKPSNLFLTKRSDGTRVIKVLDFGISKQSASALTQRPAQLTSTKAMLGSPLYMSPEQLRSSKTVDHRADIWAMGVIMYELMTGTLPFLEETLGELFAAILEKDPVPLSARVPGLPSGLEAIVARCLARRPEDRFQSAADLAAALAPFAAGATTTVALTSPSPFATSAPATTPMGPPPMGAVTPPHMGTVAMAPGRRTPGSGGYERGSGSMAPAMPQRTGPVPMHPPMGRPGAVTGSGAHVPVVKATAPLGASTPQPYGEPWRAPGATTGGSTIPKSSAVGIIVGVFAVFALVGGGAGLYAWKHRQAVPAIDVPVSAPPPPTLEAPPSAPPPPPLTVATSPEPPPSATASAPSASVAANAPKPPPPATVHTAKHPPKPDPVPDPPKTAPKPPATATAPTPTADPLGTSHR